MKEPCSEFQQKEVTRATLSDLTEEAYYGQSECNRCRLLHNGRITSSILGEIIQRRDGTDPVGIQLRIMGCTPITGLPAPFKGTRDKKATAKFAKNA